MGIEIQRAKEIQRGIKTRKRLYHIESEANYTEFDEQKN